MKQLLGLVGITDAASVHAEKIGFGPEARNAAIACPRPNRGSRCTDRRRQRGCAGIGRNGRRGLFDERAAMTGIGITQDDGDHFQTIDVPGPGAGLPRPHRGHKQEGLKV